MPGARIFVIFCYGLLGIGIQALLFREYITALDGRDIGIGLFFGTWFLWVAAGAFLFRKARRLTSQLAKAVELLLLAYIPAFLLHYGLIVFFRGAAGAESHAFATAQRILGCSLLVTAPVCLLTGLLFPVLCRWATDHGDLSIGRIYTLEAAGGTIGGLGVTALLYLGTSTAGVFVLLAVLICGAAAWSVWTESRQTRSRIKQAITAACLVAMLGAIALRADVPVTEAVHTYRWSQVVPGGTLGGSFSTAQGKYLYGTDDNRWIVVRDSRVYETVGDQTAAGRVAALALAQNTRAEHVLVIGDGLSVCESFLKSPNVKTVDWFAPDPRYVRSMLAHLPETFKVSDPRLQYVAGDIRTTLTGKPETYDIVIVNLPGTVNAALSPFLSTEFFEHVRQSLRPLGLVVLGITGGENGGGDDPAYLGACVKGTLDAVFAQTILAPAGARTYFVSAPAPYLQVSPMTLQTRFSLLENASDILPPEDLSVVYRPGRAMEVLDSYDAAALPPQLVGSDHNLNHYLGQLLQTTHDSGLSLIEPVQAMLRGGPVIVIVSIVLLALVRLIYIITTAPRKKQACSSANSDVLQSDMRLAISISGIASIATLIVLMYAYQMRYGSLHLHVGLISALFMLGLTVGAAVLGGTVSSLRRGGSQPVYFVLCVLLTLLSFHTVCLVGAGLWIEHAILTQPIFAVWLLASGLFCGGTLASSVKTLELCGLNAESTAARLRGTGHLGAAIGAGLATLFLAPLLGLQATLYVVAALVLANLVSAAGMHYKVARPGPRVIPHPVFTPLGYTLFGLALSVIVSSHILAYIERSKTKSQGVTVIQEWVEGRRVSIKTTTVAATSKQVPYHELHERSRLKGYIFRSEHFTGTVYGYGGPMSVISLADPNGTLIDFRITRSRETPRYISRIRGWMDALKGKTVFGDNPMAGVNAVSGATLSCNAILRLLRNSGGQFAASVFGQREMTQTARQDWIGRINWPLACWGAGALLALGVIYHGRLWSRLALLAFTAGVGGFWLNKQFSTDHVIRLLSGDGLPAGSIGGLCLLLGVPLLILLFGNIYCGYLCPFGALQELVGLIVPKRFKARLPLSTITAGRFVKYAVLFVLVVAFFATGSRRSLEADPLISVFDRQSWAEGFLTSYGLIIAILVLLGALLVTRMWCRYLCPTGAFLSLLNRAAWLARLLPAKKFGRCEFGLSGRDHLDCIYCDRCRYESRLIPARDDVVAKTHPNIRSRLFLIVLVGMALFTLAPLLRKAPSAAPPTAAPEISASSEVQLAPETAYPRQRRRRGR